jgi:hypothetical protein
MTWKGTLRSIAAAQRRSERAARQRHNELARRQKLLENMAELERASYEVEVYENRLDVLSSIHKDCGEAWHWGVMLVTEPPAMPVNSYRHLAEANAKLDGFRPSVADKFLKRTNARRDELAKAVDAARQLDEQEHQDALKAYEQELLEWETARDLASQVLAGRPEAYLQAIKQVDPFSEMGELGSSFEFQASDSSVIETLLHVNSEEVIPRVIKTLLKSGKLSVKEMPKTKFFELYQDYICGCVLRIARELFALLPIQIAIVTAQGKVLNTKTGQMEERPILSVAIPRDTLSALNFELLDPSNSMGNFVYRMNFKKSVGFSAVDRILPSELQSAQVKTTA